jgi:hypothetical protein
MLFTASRSWRENLCYSTWQKSRWTGKSRWRRLYCSQQDWDWEVEVII